MVEAHTLIAILHLAQQDAILETMINKAHEELCRWDGRKLPAWIEALDTPSDIRGRLDQLGPDRRA